MTRVRALLTRQGPVIVVPADALAVTQNDIKGLLQIDGHGAVSAAEMDATFQDSTRLYDSGLVVAIPTEVGELTILTSDGLRLAYGRAGRQRAGAGHQGGPKRVAYSATRQLDRGYVRLGIQAMGWQMLKQPEELTQYDTTGRMVAVRTPGGPALVIGALGKGYSWAGLMKMIERLRSTALFHNFDVIVLSPSKRATKLYRQNRAFLHRVTPKLNVGGRKRLLIAPGWGNTLPPQGPALRAALVTQADIDRYNQSGREYGPAWIHILRQPRSERVRLARQDLAFDGVMTREQLHRHYVLLPQDLEGCPCIEVAIRPVHSQETRLVTTTFFLRSAAQCTLNPNALSHLAHTAEMRFQLAIPVHAGWEYAPKNKHAWHTPDAAYDTPEGRVAVEYDTGSYPSKLIEAKLESYNDQGYVRVIWGVASRKRQTWLKAMFKRFGGLVVMLARWN